jgi:NifU-like protein
MSPTELYADHRAKPRNIGKLMNASATGDVGSIVVGDALRFYIQVKDERITAAKFQVFNSQEQVPSASALTEVALGLSLDDAWQLGHAQVSAHFGNLDPALLPPRLWAVEGLRSAIAAYRGEERDADDELDPLLCRCHGIPHETVSQSIKVMKLTTVDEVVAATGAGSACGSCRLDIPGVIAEATQAKPVAASKPTRGTGRLAMVNRINAFVDAELRPTLAEAGIEFELLDLDGVEVVVRILTSADDEARRGALGTVERLLKERVDTALSVREG